MVNENNLKYNRFSEISTSWYKLRATLVFLPDPPPPRLPFNSTSVPLCYPPNQINTLYQGVLVATQLWDAEVLSP